MCAKVINEDRPPHLVCVATLPREMLMLENKRQSETNVVINDKSQRSVYLFYLFKTVWKCMLKR